MVYFDNIIFSAQKAGGISVVWMNILSRVIRDNPFEYKCLEYPNAEKNIHRHCIDIPEQNIEYVKSRNIRITSCVNPILHKESPYVYSSSMYRVSKDKMAKNVTVVHDFTYELFRTGLARYVHSHIKNYAIRQSDIVICISENTKKDLLRFLPDINSDKIHVIYNGVSDDYNIISYDKRIEGMSDYVLFVGARDYYKNFDFVVESLKNTKYKLAICGKPLSGKEERLLVSSLGKNSFKVFSHLSNIELNRLYNSVFCLLYPSSYEGFGIPIVEAQKSGCPVIAYNCSSIPEVVCDDSALLLNNLDSSQVRECLRRLEKSIDRDNIILRGIKNSKRFSWEKTYQSYLDIYNSLL